jgi:hypothetical protein
MPWTETSVMEDRLRFVARLLEGDPMSDVCPSRANSSSAPAASVICESQDLICRTVSDRDASGMTSAAFHSDMETNGLGRTGGQARRPRKRCAGGAGLDGTAAFQALLLI